MEKLKVIILTFILGIGVGGGIIILFTEVSKFNFPENCPEIDELCEEEFLNLCELTGPELDYVKELKGQIKWLKELADIYGDTWRESDCGIEISRQQREEGIFPFEAWKRERLE